VAIAAIDVVRQHESVGYWLDDVEQGVLFDEQFDVAALAFQSVTLVAAQEAVGFTPNKLRGGLPSAELILLANACRVIQCSEGDMAQIPRRDQKLAEFGIGSLVIPVTPAFVSLACDLR